LIAVAAPTSKSSFAGRFARGLLLAALACLAPSAGAADELRIVTEELPPYSMTRDGKITGLSTEVVQAVLKEVGMRAGIQAMPWARAYDTALNSENVLIYSIMRIPQRESLFKWVGTIAPSRWYLVSMTGRNIRLGQLSDARGYRIATVNEDAGEQYLVSKGFSIGKNLQSSSKYALGYEKLKLGRVDLWITDDLNAYYLVREAGDDPDRVLAHSLELSDLDGQAGLHMAFSRTTPDALVDRFRKGLETIKKNGVYDGIQKKWR
jgi:polar amino acid transport system substrate-binding protein